MAQFTLQYPFVSGSLLRAPCPHLPQISHSPLSGTVPLPWRLLQSGVHHSALRGAWHLSELGRNSREVPVACQVTRIMLPKEVASRDTSWGYRLHCLIEPASGSPLEDRLCAGKPCRPPELLEAAVAASTRSWERLRREELPEFHLCVHVWPQEQGLVPLFCTKLLHLPYYVHLELKKLQSRLLNWLSRAFSKGGRQWGGRKVGVGAEGIQRKRPKETSWPFPRFRGVRLRCAVRLVYLEPRCWRILKSFLGLGHLGSSHLWTYLDLQFISRLTKAWPGTADCPACSEPCPAARKGSSPPPWCPTRSQRAGR